MAGTIRRVYAHTLADGKGMIRKEAAGIILVGLVVAVAVYLATQGDSSFLLLVGVGAVAGVIFGLWFRRRPSGDEAEHVPPE